ncbi:MAG: disulfide isomerase DsbC N-terminal domain-containing protein [Candidatus Nanopelagicales bacterium]
MHKRYRVIFLSLLALLSGSVAAAPNSSSVGKPLAKCSRTLTQKDADYALAQLSAKLPATRFTRAAPGPADSCLIKVYLANGNTSYVDPAGRYFFYGVVFDLTSNNQLENGGAVSNLTGAAK